MGITGWRYHHSKSAIELNGMWCLVIEVAWLWRALLDSFETPPTRPQPRFCEVVFFALPHLLSQRLPNGNVIESFP
jgi:hypothetical protein